MKYQSTRNKNIQIDSAVAIKKGLSVEGGLFVPTEIPTLTNDELAQMAQMGYQDRAELVLSKFLTDFTKKELAHCVNSAYGKKFDCDEITPIHKLDDSMYVLELWHGPTCAFKDMALQILPYFLTYSMKKTGEDNTVVILVATSGDTGKAALDGFMDIDGTKIIVFYPNEGVSDIQRLQMTTQEGGNVAVGAVEGNFDDAQTGVKMIFTDKVYEKELLDKKYVLSSANSINWGRLVPQIVYYVSSYVEMVKNGEIKNGESINICVPTGNFGNILAGYYAMKMGVPINKLICASNTNNILTDFIKTGEYDLKRDFHTTTSPSMDILISSNLERLLFDLYDRDDKEIESLMTSLRDKKSYKVSDAIKAKIDELLVGGCCDDNETLSTIKDVYEKYGYTVDTHTAVAIKVYNDYVKISGDKTKTIIASTASPFKFCDSVMEGITGENQAGKNPFELLRKCSDLSKLEIPKSLTELEKMEVRFKETFKKENMKEYVNSVLK